MTGRACPTARARRRALAPSPATGGSGSLIGAALASYLVLWALTGAGVLAGHLGLRLTSVARPRHALSAAPHTVAMLVAHNAPIALWPLALVALDWPRIPLARRIGDALIAGQLAGQGLLVGGALARHPELWRYLPHLPLEWLGLALPAGAWLTARSSARPRRETASVALLSLGVLTAAAILETYLVPIP